MALPEKRIKTVTPPDNQIYEIVPERLGQGEYAAELPTLSQDEILGLAKNDVIDIFDLSYIAGSSASTNYKTVRWYGSYNISEPYDGMKILVRIPRAGLGTVGAMLNLSENTDAGYHPIAYNVNTVFTTHYPVSTYKLFVYDASASMTVYKTATVAETVTGVWKGEADYYADNDYRVRTYLLTTTDGNRDLLLRYSTTAVSTKVGGYTQQMAATGNSLYANPSTGALGAVTFIENGTPLSQLYAPIGGGGGNAEWGSISGTLSNQTDLMSKFDEYAPVSALSSYATLSLISSLNYASVGAASTAHTHTYSDVGAASAAHTHTYSDVGALSAATFIPSTYTDVGAMSAGKTFTYADVGALSSGTHIPSDPVNADWSATTGLSSIKNKPTLGTAASMASTAFRPASWMPTYSDVGALSSATVIPSTYSDVGAASASHTHTDYVEREGDTMIGQLVAQNNIAYTTAQVRNIILSTSEPTSTDGGNGDIWIVYKE